MTKDPSWPRAQVEKVANPIHGQAVAPHHCVEGQCEMGGLMARIAQLQKEVDLWKAEAFRRDGR